MSAHPLVRVRSIKKDVQPLGNVSYCIYMHKILILLYCLHSTTDPESNFYLVSHVHAQLHNITGPIINVYILNAMLCIYFLCENDFNMYSLAGESSFHWQRTDFQHMEWYSPSVDRR